jgi:hypothetical protein
MTVKDEEDCIVTWKYCLNCHNVVRGSKPKGYVSYLDLEESGWSVEI